MSELRLVAALLLPRRERRPPLRPRAPRAPCAHLKRPARLTRCPLPRNRQGYRPEMEDQHTCATNIPGLEGHGFFAVYDGHGGDKAAILSERMVLPSIQKQKQYQAYVAAPPAQRDPVLLAQAMADGFVACDAEMRPKLPPPDTSGTTAVAVFITPTHIICANAGDSRGVYCKGQVVALSEDHKPDDAGERARIERAGGHVAQGMMGMGPMRVDGDLAVSRCLGDFEYKRNQRLPPVEQKVSPLPECRTFVCDPAKDEMLVLACDGIWDVMSNQEVCDFVRMLLAEGEKDIGLVAEVRAPPLPDDLSRWAAPLTTPLRLSGCTGAAGHLPRQGVQGQHVGHRCGIARCKVWGQN